MWNNIKKHLIAINPYISIAIRMLACLGLMWAILNPSIEAAVCAIAFVGFIIGEEIRSGFKELHKAIKSN